MSKRHSSSFQPFPPQNKSKPYYIVKDDFITNLRKGRKCRANTEPVQYRQPTFVRDSCVIIDKKSEIIKKLPFRSNNDFYELDKQIKNNSRNLYRKMTVAIRRENMGSIGKIKNPFTKQVGQRNSRRSFNQQKNLSDLIYYVQPYWIKKYISKTPSEMK